MILMRIGSWPAFRRLIYFSVTMTLPLIGQARSLREHNVAHWSGHTALAAALAHLGRIIEAQNVVKEVFQHRPDFSLSVMRRSLSLKHEEYLDVYLSGLRLAGLPE